MLKNDPEQLILSWLDEIPKKYRDILVGQYIFMTCTESGDLVLSGDAAWQYFRKKMTEPDFPLRRVARLLTTRSLLSFLLILSLQILMGRTWPMDLPRLYHHLMLSSICVLASILGRWLKWASLMPHCRSGYWI